MSRTRTTFPTLRPLGATPRTLRELNAQAVLAALVAEHPTSRAELARTTGMAKPTVGHALEMLLAAGLVRPVSPPASPRRRVGWRVHPHRAFRDRQSVHCGRFGAESAGARRFAAQAGRVA